MCYAIPGKIIRLKEKENIAILDYYGEHRNVLNELLDVKIGDYVYAQGGIIIDKISKKEALEILNFWKQKFQELKKTDKKLSKVKDIKASDNLFEILQKVNYKKELSKEDMLFLLNLKNPNEFKLLYEFANNLRQKEHDNACCVHGIIEFSNYCKNDCYYCGIRNSRNIKRYRMSPKQIIDIVKHAVKQLGFKALVLQSGEDSWYNEEKLINIIRELKKLGILIFLSIGIKSKETYDKLYKAGARAVLLRFETSNKNIFHELRPNTDFDERINLIKYLKSKGWIIATGFLIGLPEESQNDIINNILLTKELKTDMYSFGPFIPCKNTPLQNEPLINKNIILKSIAISRLLDKKAKILVTTALESLDKNSKKQGLLAGANSLMINITPKKYRHDYYLYPGRLDKNKEITDNIEETINLLYSIGRAPTDIGV